MKRKEIDFRPRLKLTFASKPIAIGLGHERKGSAGGGSAEVR